MADFRLLERSALAQEFEEPTQAEACAECGGIGWLTKQVPYGHPDFGKLFPCRCKQAEIAGKRLAELARLSNLAAFQDKTFASFDQLVPGVQAAYQQAEAFARRPEGWLTLLGPYGCGKTHLAAAVAQAVLAHGVPVLFVVVPDLLDHLRATFSPESTVSYDERFDLVRNVGLLVLDDLGTESATLWAREKLYQLINHRYNERLPTIFTSNVRLDQLDPRIASRLYDPVIGGEVISIQAPDYRRRLSKTTVSGQQRKG
jgi:DNA replication protein DnaC